MWLVALQRLEVAVGVTERHVEELRRIVGERVYITQTIARVLRSHIARSVLQASAGLSGVASSASDQHAMMLSPDLIE